eukprot:g7410.t1
MMRSVSRCPSSPQFPSLRESSRHSRIRKRSFRRTLHLVSMAAQKQPRGRRSGSSTRVETNDWDPQSYQPPPPPPPPRIRSIQLEPESPNLSNFTNAIVVGAFVLGIGAGVYFTSDVTTSPSNVASLEFVDRRTPNSEICMANGYSSMVFDQRLFVSLNPFNVYITQPEVKPGCILRQSNFGVLENRRLVSKSTVDNCKKGMNTFAFVGDLNDSPEISCVYHSEDAENQFLVDPKRAVMGDGFQPRPK